MSISAKCKIEQNLNLWQGWDIKEWYIGFYQKQISTKILKLVLLIKMTKKVSTNMWSETNAVTIMLWQKNEIEFRQKTENIHESFYFEQHMIV